LRSKRNVDKNMNVEKRSTSQHVLQTTIYS